MLQSLMCQVHFLYATYIQLPSISITRTTCCYLFEGLLFWLEEIAKTYPYHSTFDPRAKHCRFYSSN